jgi:hypothetical protein
MGRLVRFRAHMSAAVLPPSSVSLPRAPRSLRCHCAGLHLHNSCCISRFGNLKRFCAQDLIAGYGHVECTHPMVACGRHLWSGHPRWRP